MIGLVQNSTRAVIDTLCCDCAHVFERTKALILRCPRCRSPRLRTHSELTELTIAHIDCDAFFTAIEKRDDPSLIDKPVLVGGGMRGVVAAACYVARIYGIHSAMSMAQARRLCPQAVVIRGNGEKYVAASRAMREIMLRWTPLVQPISIDEAFLDLTGTEKLHKICAAGVLVQLAKMIATEIGITVSIGLSHNKFLAKIASKMDKPRGFAMIGKHDTQARLAPLAIGEIWGVGPVLTRRLVNDGITHIRDIQALSKNELFTQYGTTGTRLERLARGDDNRPVTPHRDPVKSISHETTFDHDISELKQLEKHLWNLSEKTATRAKTKKLAGYVVTLKLKSNKFKTITRNQTFMTPTQLTDTIFKSGRYLLTREHKINPHEHYRLIGIGIHELTTATIADPFDLLDPQKPRRIKAEHTIDRLRDKFGRDAIKKGRSL